MAMVTISKVCANGINACMTADSNGHGRARLGVSKWEKVGWAEELPGR
jgi:hypothetical protein